MNIILKNLALIPLITGSVTLFSFLYMNTYFSVYEIQFSTDTSLFFLPIKHYLLGGMGLSDSISMEDTKWYLFLIVLVPFFFTTIYIAGGFKDRDHTYKIGKRHRNLWTNKVYHFTYKYIIKTIEAITVKNDFVKLFIALLVSAPINIFCSKYKQ